MNDPVSTLIAAMAAQDPEGIRAAYAPGARLVTVSADSVAVREGAAAVAGKLADWYAGWEEGPIAHPYLRVTRAGDRAFVEIERTSTYAGAPWVVRQAHVLQLGAGGIVEHHAYCTGPRAGAPELAEVAP